MIFLLSEALTALQRKKWRTFGATSGFGFLNKLAEARSTNAMSHVLVGKLNWAKLGLPGGVRRAHIIQWQVRPNTGRFPFSQNFRNFRFGGKWHTFRRFVPLEYSQKQWKIQKGGPVFPVGIGMLCSIYVSRSLYQFQVHGRAPRHVPGFTTKWNNLLPIGNSTFATT